MESEYCKVIFERLMMALTPDFTDVQDIRASLVKRVQDL